MLFFQLHCSYLWLIFPIYSYFLLPTSSSYFPFSTSYFLLPTSYFLLPTSYFLLPTTCLLLSNYYFSSCSITFLLFHNFPTSNSCMLGHFSSHWPIYRKTPTKRFEINWIMFRPNSETLRGIFGLPGQNQIESLCKTDRSNVLSDCC